MLSGNFERSLDSKNRITLPPLYKNEDNNIFYMTKASGKIELRDSVEFNKYIEKIDQNNDFDQSIQKFKRFILSSTIKIELDKVGRFIIPESFKTFIAVEKTVSFIGMGSYIEMWSPEKLNENIKEFEDEENIDKMFKYLNSKWVK